ncbi:MAG: glycerate kinase [Halioglobus sp.]
MRAGLDNPREFLLELFHIAVAAADPHRVLLPWLPQDTQRRALVIGAGKAAAAMASALENHWAGELSGLVIAPYGHGEPCRRIEVVEAAHPVPDARSEAAALRILAQVSRLGPADLVICLLSGGGSSLLCLPPPGVSLADKQAVTGQLLRCGAPIDAVNCVRKHLSLIKGGRLARACLPAQLITFAISDVPGDHPEVIASGPTVPDTTSSAEALGILRRYDIAVPPAIRAWLDDVRSETVKDNDPAFARSEFHIVATAQQSLQAAANAAREAGAGVLMLGDDVAGEARDVARAQAAVALSVQRLGAPLTPPCLILSGGETSVTLRGAGRGGRNTEFLLALASALAGAPGIHALAADTDGIDGDQDNAGALLSPHSWARARRIGLDAAALLADTNSHGFFAALGDLVVTGPSRTNVNDFRAVLVLPAP